MAQDDYGQSLDDSSSIPPAPKPASPGAAGAVAPPRLVAGPADTLLPTATTASSTATATSTSTSSPSAAGALATPSASTAGVPASTAAHAASIADFQQNGDSRASEPEVRPDSDMSNQHPGAPHGLPVSYPGSSSPYPSAAGIPSAQYASYPTVTSQPAEAYRPNPVPIGSNNMSLPSMRTIDSMPQQPGAAGGSPHSMSMNMPMAPVPGGVPYYGHHNMGLAPSYGLQSDAMARYALPHDPRLLGHRGPKKEIKRRTKTGCLTCRKRRIKCDETHPTCNNCKKSKRECLGYDPIFRQQPGGQSTTNIQPAPSTPTQPTPPSTLPSSVPLSVPSSAPAIGARTNSYGNQPSMLPSSYATSQASPPAPLLSTTAAPAYDSTLSAPAPTGKPEQGYEYQAPSIDPALQTLPSNTQSSVQDTPRLLDRKPYFDSNFHLRAKKMKIDEIIDLLGSTPPAQQINHNEETFNEVVKVYHEMYAPGLSSFFETGWYYFAENGQMTFPKNPKLIERMASFLKILEGVKVNDHSLMASSGILETRLVWDLSRTCYDTPHMVSSATAPSTLPQDGDAKEAKNRVQAVEALLCGEYLATNPLTPPYQDVDTQRTRQFDFWYNLAEFVRSRNDLDAPSTAGFREEVLARMRHLLDGRENRDVLYSIAVVRHLAPSYDPAQTNGLPQHFDESDPRHRLAVASKFIYDESRVTGGTTNTVRRYSDIASRAFVNPGVNIARLPTP